MSSYTRAESEALAILPKISAVFSLAGSTWIAIEVLTHGGNNPKRFHPYHRLLLAMSVYDILESVWNFGSSWPMPEDSGRLWAVGNQSTCGAQGFFLTLSSAVPVYNALLAVYYMLVIKFQYSDRILKTRVEPMMHCIAGGWAFMTAITAGALGLYNDATLWCWIAPYPPDCKDSLRHGPDEANCERGDNAWVFQFAFYFGPLWCAILMATACTLIVYYYVRKLDERTLKYRKPRLKHLNSNFSTTADGGGGGVSNSMVSASAPFGKKYNNDDDDDENDDDDDDNDDDNTNSGRQHQRRVSFFNEPQQEREQEQQEQQQSSSPEQQRISSASSQAALQAQAELAEDEREDKFLGGRTSEDERCNGNGNDQSMEFSGSFHSRGSFARIDQIKNTLYTWKQQRRIYREDYARTIEVMHQALFYLGVFYATHVWSTTTRILQATNAGETPFGVVLMHAWFDPLQGFLNYFVYQRPRYMYLRKTRPELGRLGACVRVLHFSFMKQREAQETIQSIYNNNNSSSNNSRSRQNSRASTTASKRMISYNSESGSEQYQPQDASLPASPSSTHNAADPLSIRRGSVVSRGASFIHRPSALLNDDSSRIPTSLVACQELDIDDDDIIDKNGEDEKWNAREVSEQFSFASSTDTMLKDHSAVAVPPPPPTTTDDNQEDEKVLVRTVSMTGDVTESAHSRQEAGSTTSSNNNNQ